MGKQLLLLLCVGLVTILAGYGRAQSTHPGDVTTCGLNEEYKCRRRCPPETCARLVAKFKCVEEKCRNGCFCKDGYLRARPGAPCKPFKQCAEWKNGNFTCGKNEQFGCRNACPPETCISQVAFFNCITDQSCDYKCNCKENYLREKSDSECKPYQKCSQLENSPDFPENSE